MPLEAVLATDPGGADEPRRSVVRGSGTACRGRLRPDSHSRLAGSGKQPIPPVKPPIEPPTGLADSDALFSVAQQLKAYLADPKQLNEDGTRAFFTRKRSRVRARPRRTLITPAAPWSRSGSKVSSAARMEYPICAALMEKAKASPDTPYRSAKLR